MSCRFYGVMAVYATPDLAFGSVISGFFYSFWNLFAGAFSSPGCFSTIFVHACSQAVVRLMSKHQPDVWVIMASV